MAVNGMIIATDYHPIYRHSFTSVYYLYDIPSNTLTKISNNTIQEPLLNVNGSKVAYAFENNLYVFDVASDRKSTRLNSSHVRISYAVFCLKKKKPKKSETPHYT